MKRLTAVVLGLMCLSLIAGEIWLNPVNVYYNTLYQTIIFELRLPRTILAVTVGFALGISGAALQGLLHNPLAEPGVLGVSSGAGLGAVLMLYFGWQGLHYPVFLGGIMGSAIITTLLIMKRGTVETLILLGIAIASFTGALIALLLNLAPSPWAVVEMMTWLMGSFKDRTFTDVFYALPPIIIGVSILLFQGRGLNALTLGHETAESMGFSQKKMRLVTIIGVCMATGASVSAVGIIGFVGLIAPHIVRVMGTINPRDVLWPSGLMGAALLLVADIGVRLIPTRVELHIGVMTALLGAPIFLHLLAKRLWR